MKKQITTNKQKTVEESSRYDPRVTLIFHFFGFSCHKEKENYICRWRWNLKLAVSSTTRNLLHSPINCFFIVDIVFLKNWICDRLFWISILWMKFKTHRKRSLPLNNPTLQLKANDYHWYCCFWVVIENVSLSHENLLVRRKRTKE